jgi:Tfp pilus assembly protein FimT
MKRLARKLMLATTIALAVSGIAQAKDDDDDRKGCSASTLRGLYAFTASGFNIVGGVAQPKAIVELIRFNGDGTLTVPEATVSINGNVTQSLPNGSGTYTIRADCTGSLAFGSSGGPTYDIFVGFRSSVLYMIQTGPGSPVFQGKAEWVLR